MVKNVHIGRGLLGRLGEFLPPDKRVVTICDTTVYEIFRERIDPLGDHIIIGQGEERKTLATIEKIHERLIALGADRDVFVLGFGGGIATDVAGFAAATYLRGVDCGFVATTLLAQVDASVGGKNGVNVGGYKNMAGTFRQPSTVVCDVDALDTLPEREFRAGLAEVIKAGIIGDAALFELVERDWGYLRADKSLLEDAVRAAVAVKARIVDADEREKGERRKLNLGHTFGHAIEHLTSEFNHGEAVAIGIVMACEMSVSLGVMDAPTAERIRRTLERNGLPVELPAAGKTSREAKTSRSGKISREALVDAARRDKKSADGQVHFVLPRAIGEVEVKPMTL